MQIAPDFEVKDWKDLNLDAESQNNWDKAIDVLRTRITERYISPVDLLLDKESKLPFIERRFGFAVVAIDCFLIEALQAFIDGRKQTKDREGQNTFSKFMTKSPNLGKFFTSKLAKRFYRDYRCGLLHQAETKNGSLIWSEFEVVSVLDGTMIINRTELHRLIKCDFEHYLESLSDITNKQLRQNFIKKMNFICQV